MLGAQWLTPASPGMDPLQQRLMKTMPLIFAVLFLFFPAGLVLYYAVNGGLGLLQQWIITRRFAAVRATRREECRKLTTPSPPSPRRTARAASAS